MSAAESAAQLISLLAPPRCGVCAARCGAAEPICGGCDSRLSRARPLTGAGPSGVELVISAGAHDGPAGDLARALKFGRRVGLAERAAAAILAAAVVHRPSGVLVPVPPDPLRFRARGFDPAAEIAAALARAGGFELRPCLRRAPGRRQVGRPRRERLRHGPRVRTAAAVPSEALLVDDVWTTGATLSACAMALRGAGAESVTALTLAHAR